VQTDFTLKACVKERQSELSQFQTGGDLVFDARLNPIDTQLFFQRLISEDEKLFLRLAHR
jgi:porphobilinogen deaminase